MGVFSRHRSRIAITLVPIGLALLCVSGTIPFDALRGLDDFVYDNRLRATMPGTLDERVVIVDIDEPSLAEFGQWPWTRDKMARLADELFNRQQVAVAGFDVLFAEPDDSSGLASLNRLAKGPLRDQPAFAERLRQLQPELDYDARFAQSLVDRPVVLGYYFTSDRGGETHGVLPAPVLRGMAAITATNESGTRVDSGSAETPRVPLISAWSWNGAGGNLAQLADAAPRAGYMNSISDADGVLRSVALISEFRGNYYETLSLAMYRVLRGMPRVLPEFVPGQEDDGRTPLVLSNVLLEKEGVLRSLPVDARAAMLVPFRGPGGARGGSYRYVAAGDLLAGRVEAASLRGRVVLVGTTAPGLLDLRITPVGKTYPGVETHANLLSGLLDGNIPVRPDYESGYEAFTILVAGVVLAIGLPLLSVPWAVLLTAAVVGGLVGVNFSLFAREGLVLPLATPVLAALAAFAVNMGYGYFIESRSKRQLAKLFGTYVPRELVAEMLREPENYSMQAENRELTVMFCDMRGFTALSERMEPIALQAMLNEIFSRLTEIIRAHRGTIDKYMGDCVMAFWGAPVAMPHHARLAISAAIEMQNAIRALNAEHATRGIPSIGVGIGLNTGLMCVGDMGSDIRRSYTVIGDAVNLASRLEGLSTVYGVEIVASEATRVHSDKAFGWLELDRVMVKGRQQEVTIYAPFAPQSGVTAGEDEAIWCEVLHAWRTQDYKRAAMLLTTIQPVRGHGTLHALYARRVGDALGGSKQQVGTAG